MSKKLKIAILVILAIAFLTGNILATQVFAKFAGYQELLGSPLFYLSDGELSVYFPFMYWVWFIKFYNDAPEMFMKCMSYIGLVFGIGIIVVGFLKKKLMPKQLTSCGTARWATKEEAKKFKLYDGAGFFVGKDNDGYYLRDNDIRHAIIVAPTRSGKGVGLVIPTGLYWKESIFFIDIKNENYEKTSGYQKKMGHTVIRLAPADLNSACYNPLDEVRYMTDFEVKDLENIIKILVQPANGSMDSHWTQAAEFFICGVAMHLLYKNDGHVSFGDIYDFIFGEISIRDRLIEMTNYPHAKTNKQKEFFAYSGYAGETHDYVRKKAFSCLNKEPKEFSSIVSTAADALKIYSERILRKNTEYSSFKARDLMCAEKPMAVYLTATPTDLVRLESYYRLVVTLLIQQNTEELKKTPHKLLLMLDEFPALGRMDILQKGMGYIAGYGIRAVIIVQTMKQLYDLYGKHNTIIDNCHTRIFHTPNDEDTPEYLSKALGKETIEVINKSFQNDLMQFMGENTYNVQEKGRELMTANEIANMDRNDEIVFVTGIPPIRCKKVKYFEDENMKSRELEPAPSESLYDIAQQKQYKAQLLSEIREKEAELVRYSVLYNQYQQEEERAKFKKYVDDKLNKAKQEEENKEAGENCSTNIELLRKAEKKRDSDSKTEDIENEEQEEMESQNSDSDDTTTPTGFNDMNNDGVFVEGTNDTNIVDYEI